MPNAMYRRDCRRASGRILLYTSPDSWHRWGWRAPVSSPPRSWRRCKRHPSGCSSSSSSVPGWSCIESPPDDEPAPDGRRRPLVAHPQSGLIGRPMDTCRLTGCFFQLCRASPPAAPKSHDFQDNASTKNKPASAGFQNHANDRFSRTPLVKRPGKVFTISAFHKNPMWKITGPIVYDNTLDSLHQSVPFIQQFLQGISEIEDIVIPFAPVFSERRQHNLI